MSGEHQELSNRVGTLEIEINNLRNELKRERTALTIARKLVAQAEQLTKDRCEQLLGLRSDADAQLHHLQAVITHAQKDNAALQLQNDLISNSTVWRLTAPIRSMVSAASPRLRMQTRRMIKFLYWIVTPHKIQQRIFFLRARKADQPAVPPPPAVENLPAHEVLSTAALSDPLEKVAADAASQVLGRIEDIGTQRVSIGIVAFHTPAEDLCRLIASARAALARCGSNVSGDIRVLDNAGTLNLDDLPGGTVLDTANNPGFASGHNLCMKAAFENGATVYLAANPKGSFHPDCIRNLLAMHRTQDTQALIEARQFPEEHPKYYDPADLTTPWVSGACMLIPQPIWEQTGGFDPNFFLYCEDVDFSWRCRALGFKTLVCPSALFWHDITGRPHETWRWGAMLLAGRYLAYKWRDLPFMEWTENRLIEESFVSCKQELPPLDDLPIAPDDTGVADFRFSLHFAPTRW